jgi:IS5 family transposase
MHIYELDILQALEQPERKACKMRPVSSPSDEPQGDLFRVELSSLVNDGHPLVRLAGRMAWTSLDERLSPHCHPHEGAPAKPTRLMAGLQYLKYTYDLSDEDVMARWVENPYWQFFGGVKYFEHALPIDPSSMTRWRKRVGEEGIEALLRETIETGMKTGAVTPRSFTKLNVDTTVQEKAIAFPTDARLYQKMRVRLVNLAQRHGVVLRQSYVRVGKRALVQVGRYAHAKQMKRKRKAQRKLKTYLGRVVRDIERKINNNPALSALFDADLCKARRLLTQQRNSKNKLYSIDAPEVECISKGKAHKRYEFGVKVGVVSTSKEGFILGCQAFHGNPYDGHTLNQSLAQALSGRAIEGDVFVDKGYRKHNYSGTANVHIAGRSTKRMTRPFRRWYKRRSAIEPLIGHMKNDGRLDRNYLQGQLGDQLNAMLIACGQNMRLLLNRFSLFSDLYASILLVLQRLHPLANHFKTKLLAAEANTHWN